MKVEQLTLSNYRGAHSLSLAFDKKLNVFFGVNGAGKSTVLDAIAIMLSWTVSRIRHAGASGRPIAEIDISNGAPLATIQLACCFEQSTLQWKLVKGKKGYGLHDQRSQLSELSEYTKQIQSDFEAKTESFNLPLFVYYPVNRAVLDIPLRIKEKHSFDLFGAYDDVLTSGANFRTFFEWFREREDLENESYKYKFEQDLLLPRDNDQSFQYPDPQLEVVRYALNQFLPSFQNFTVRRNPLRMEVTKEGKCVTVNQLSDGEKCLIALIGDLARRMAIANPTRISPLEGDAIVLIDEIDLHLHPKWQRMVVSKLQQVFPNTQFIVSTHSPHVITHVKPENLYLLKQPENGMTAERPIESYGKNVDRILEDLMGLETTRPKQVFIDLDDIYKKIDLGLIDEARILINLLRNSIGDDPELVKAEVLIKRREIIGK